MEVKIPWENKDKLGAIFAEYDKQNKEVLQIVNQRFQLITLAVIGTVTILGWLGSNLTKLKETELIGQIQILSLCGVVFLCSLYILSFRLLGTMRVFTTLIQARYETADSPLRHEHLWRHFTRKPYSAYSKPYASVYLILAFAVFLVPLFFRPPYDKYPVGFFDGAIFVAFSLFFVFVWLTTWQKLWSPDERELLDRWNEAIESLSREKAS